MFSRKINKRTLESFLQPLDPFEDPKVHLEQYQTPPDIAAELFFLVSMQLGPEEFEGQRVADFGCGTGIFSLASAALGAEAVHAFDVDTDCLAIAARNVEESGMTAVELIQTDLLVWTPPPSEKPFDTVVMNPPFGAQETETNNGIDAKFIEKAVESCSGNVYVLLNGKSRVVSFICHCKKC
eukprot:TRINITY_DN4551_c0_g2_i3.p1 TRINITY_DN4551_c0_g2~~TRINITY_DN4551_c0_g2_i3.p1  ORF type:complete len:182 (-),score=42.65 TRINITY_DN4551_c0_g2_i3:285-830(-)